MFFRGSKASPRFFVRYKDAAGVWRSRRVRQETRRDALALARSIEAKEERRAHGLELPAHAAVPVRELMARWQAGLTNRSARNDQFRIARHLVPRFGALRVADLSMAVVVLWLDDIAAAGTMKPGSQRGLLGLLSRFCSWAVDRSFMATNPCKAIPNGRRPRHSPSCDAWISDDAVIIKAMALMPEPHRWILYLANRSALRTGEACGLRMNDLEWLAEGTIRVRFSYLGPLKEDKAGRGKTKYVPAPIDAPTVLGPWIDRRRTEGAAADDLVFAARDGRFPYGKDEIGYHWRKARDAMGLSRELSFHRAGRHSAATRGLAAGASIDEISQMLGHASVAMTQARYLHFQRRSFSDALRAPLTGPVAPIIPIAAARAPTAQPEQQQDAIRSGDEQTNGEGERKAGGR